MKLKKSWTKGYGKDELSIRSVGRVTVAARTPGNPLEISTAQSMYEGTTWGGLRNLRDEDQGEKGTVREPVLRGTLACN